MSLPGVFSDHMFLCSKYAVRPTSTRDSIKDAVTHAFMASVDVYLQFSFIVYDFYVFCMLLYLLCCLSGVIINKKN